MQRAPRANERRIAVSVWLAATPGGVEARPASAHGDSTFQASTGAYGGELLPSQVGETIRSRLTLAQLAFAGDKTDARRLLSEARAAYTGSFVDALAAANP